MGSWVIFQNIYMGGTKVKLRFWVGIGTLGGGDFFFRLDLKISFTKNSEYKSQAKKNDSDCNFYNFWLLVPYPNKFVVVCICTVIFHGIYSPQPTDIIFAGGLNFFLCLLARGWEYFIFLGDLLHWRVLICFLGEAV